MAFILIFVSAYHKQSMLKSDSAQNRSISLDDAVRTTGALSFNLMVKPVGSACNLNCTYCYYLDKAGIYAGREPKMSDEDLLRYVKTFIESCEVPQVTFNWHGGEPLMAGLDFYKKAVKYQKLFAAGKKIVNTIQTNGTLLTPEWAQFLREEDFLVGVSVDGPREIHDRMRTDKGNHPTFDRVMRGVEQLYRAGVQYNLLTAVSNSSEGHALEIYQFLKTLGTPYIQFLPVCEMIIPAKSGNQEVRPAIAAPGNGPAVKAPWNISPEGWGRFLCGIFDRWVRHDVGKVFVNVFDATLAGWCGATPGSCIFDSICGGNAVMEHNGDIYPCDHFVYPGMKIGNLYRDNLKDLMRGEKQTRFGAGKRLSLTNRCLGCKYLPICNGECPKHRFETLPGEDFRHNSLCEGYYEFFRHSEDAMLKMRQMLLQNGI